MRMTRNVTIWRGEEAARERRALTRPQNKMYPVLNYKAVYLTNIESQDDQEMIRKAFMNLENVSEVAFQDGYAEVYLKDDVQDEVLKDIAEGCGEHCVLKIDS